MVLARRAGPVPMPSSHGPRLRRRWLCRGSRIADRSQQRPSQLRWRQGSEFGTDLMGSLQRDAPLVEVIYCIKNRSGVCQRDGHGGGHVGEQVDQQELPGSDCGAAGPGGAEDGESDFTCVATD